MRVLGIDPGKKGGYCLIGPTGELKLYARMELNGREISVQPFVNLLCPSDSVKTLVVIEKVHSMPGQSSQSTFTFAEGYGKIKGVCEALGVSYELVHPQTWKREVLQGSDRSKEAAIEWVKRRYPEVDLGKGGRVDSDGIADAVCIAEYGRRKFL